MANKGLTVIAILSACCFIIELLPVISVPITSMDSPRLYLCNYRNVTFGVFGVCDEKTHQCTKPKIGYIQSSDHFLQDEEDYDGIRLPSTAVSSISKLLVVHVVAVAVTGLLMITIFVLLGFLYLHREGVFDFRKGSKKPEEVNEMTSVSETSIRSHVLTKQVDEKDWDVTPVLQLMLFFSLISFLLTLLAFLADLLLFIPELSYLGWLQLIPIILHAIVIMILCFIKRSISSRRYLEVDQNYEMDDMRRIKNVPTWDDSASDDGFYVYTNGFYSTYDNTDHEVVSNDFDIRGRSIGRRNNQSGDEEEQEMHSENEHTNDNEHTNNNESDFNQTINVNEHDT
ncbi:uncharacterized protein PRCAT00006289001 [Priceomyces carsonii]|uniref:uncharacterized protein n=1 Tax=Priceomyces carsonii TaxID=28549 RepID=UPI002ED82CCF|nr:unnamed protein product [Priceomyces carsonii]